MRLSIRFLPVVALLAAPAAFPQTLPQGVQKVTSVEGITEYSWPNGLRVLLFPDQSQPKVTVNITYLVGSRHEGNGEAGMAHLMEHMLFLRTKSGKDIKKEMTDRGAEWNGSTSDDRTNYYETVTASDENLAWALELEAERMTGMRIEKELLDKEMTVVRNEFEMGENNPIGVLEERTIGAAYSSHPYGRTTIGTRSDIENVPIDKLDAFYHKFYRPDNAVVMVAGKFDESKALADVAAGLGTIPKPQTAIPKTYSVEPPQEGERSLTLRRRGDNQAVFVVYHTPAAAHPDMAALEMLAGVLGDTPSGRLYKALVDTKKAVSVGAYERPMHDPGLLMAMAELRPEQNIDEAREIALRTLTGISQEPPTQQEVDQAKTRFAKQIDLLLTNSQRVGLYLSEAMAAGDWRLLFLVRDRVRDVTAQDVARVAKAYLKDTNRTVGVFIPTATPDTVEIPAAPDAAAALKDYKGGEAISAGEAFSPTPANIEARILRSKLPGGMNLELLPKKTRGGAVVARIQLDFGDEQSVFGRTVAGAAVTSMLSRGTKTKSRQQLQEAFDKLKTNWGVSGNAVGVSVTLQTTEANLADALRLAAEVLRQPAFDEKEFDQWHQERLASIEQTLHEPMSIAPNEVQRHLNPYPHGHLRHVSTLEERLDDAKNLTLQEVRQFYADFYGASNGAVLVAGQFDPVAMQKLAAELFADWKSPKPYTRVPEVYHKVDATDRKFETPDKQNAMLGIGMTAKMSDADPDYPAMLVANYIFGGSSGSRLYKRIRDKEGLSYGVYSGFLAPPLDDGGYFVMQAISAPQNAPKVEASFRDELARTLKDGFTAEEVALAKKSWLDGVMVGRANDSTLLAYMGQNVRFGRTFQWEAGLEAKVAALTPEQVNAAFRSHIDPAALFTVKAGDFKKAGAYQQ
jgi:zinc protease